MTKAKFIAFEKVRESGLTNMFDINKVMLIALAKFNQELTKKDCFDILLKYDKYKIKYGHKKD